MPSSITQNVIVVGSTGLIGGEIGRLLSDLEGGTRYRVLGAHRSSDPPFDIQDIASMRRYLGQAGSVEHIIVAAGEATFGRFAELSTEDFATSLRSKLMGQVNVVRESWRYLSPGGSITLTSGELAHTPIPGSSAVALVNGAVDAFVRAATLDLPAAVRLNVVSPGWIAETREKLGLDRAGSFTAREVARLYLQVLEGRARGTVLTSESLRESARRAVVA